jgi:hypothetical protein
VKEARSLTARCRRISTRISSGMVAMGQGGDGEASVGGGRPGIERLEKSLIRDARGVERPWRECWVVEALDGLGC